MPNNFLEEYLVRIGFSNDEPSFRKLQTMMADAERSVTNHASGMAKRILELQSGVVGAFTSMSSAILGVADKAAMADQSYRLLGLRMLMTTESARKMDMITKALGASLGEIVWDPELRARALQMGQDIDRWSASLGGGFKGAMKQIRDLHYEFKELEIAAQFIGFRFAEDLARKMGIGDITTKVREFINSLSPEKIQQWSDTLTDYAVPVLKETWEILKGLAEVAKQSAIAFTNIIGVLQGDSSIEGTEFSFKKLAVAIQHVQEDLVALLKWIAHAETALPEFVSAIALALSGKFSAARDEFKKGLAELSSIGLSGPKKSAAASSTGSQKPEAAGGGIEPTSTSGVPPGQNQPAAPFKIGGWSFGNPFTFDWSEYAHLVIGDKLKQQLQQTVDNTRDWLKMHGEEPNMEPLKNKAQSLDAIKPPPGWALGTPKVDEAIDSTLVNALAALIAKRETGGKPDSVGMRHNNPGDLRSWGNYPVINGYVQFPDMETGMRALRQQIEKNIRRGLSLNEFFAGQRDASGNVIPGGYPGFSPEKDNNDPKGYAAWIAQMLHIDPDTPLKQYLQAMAKPEQIPQQSTPAAPAAPASTNAADSVSPDWFSYLKIPDWFEATRAWFTMPLARDDATAQAYGGQNFSSAFAAAQRPIIPPADVRHTEYNVKIDVGGVYMSNSDKDPRDIQRQVADAVDAAFRRQTQFDLSQLMPAY